MVWQLTFARSRKAGPGFIVSADNRFLFRLIRKLISRETRVGDKFVIVGVVAIASCILNISQSGTVDY